jgi:hypothetical protein
LPRTVDGRHVMTFISLNYLFVFLPVVVGL